MSGILVPEHVVKSVPKSWMQLLSNFAATWGKFDGPAFGFHCSKCGQDVQAANDPSDQVLSVKCACQEFKSDAFTIL